MTLLATLKCQGNATNELRISMRVRSSSDHRGRVSTAGKDLVLHRPLTSAHPLVNSSELAQHIRGISKPAEKNGFGGLPQCRRFTRYAARSVKEAAQVLSERFGKQSIFLTGTLPGSTDPAVRSLAAYSSWVVREVTRWIRKKAPKARYLFVWEYQKRGALHCHLLCASDDVYALDDLTADWHRIWCHILRSVSKKANVNLFLSDRSDGKVWTESDVRTDAQWTVKDLARYLSKYVSKVACKMANRRAYPPTRWWSVDDETRSEYVRRRTVAVLGEYCFDGVNDLFERVASYAVGASVSVFRVVNPYAPSDIGLVCFCLDGMAQRIANDISQQLEACKKIVRNGVEWIHANPCHCDMCRHT
jgi:hypothetical protein